MKLRNKLIMSGVALAACAATLTSTTYAWYTTNTEVSATGISGAALESGTSSIYISLDGEEWGQSVDLTDALTGTLVPVSLDGTKKFRKLSNTASDAGFMGAEASGNDVVSFTLYFKTAVTTTNVNIYFKDILVKNKATSLSTVDNLLYNKSYTKVLAGATYEANNHYYTYLLASYSPVVVTSLTFAELKNNLYIHNGSKYVQLADDAEFTEGKTYYTYRPSSYVEISDETKATFAAESTGAAAFATAIANGLYVPAADQTASNGAGVNRSNAKYGVDFIKALGMTTSWTSTGDSPTTTFAAYDLGTKVAATALGDTNVSLSQNQNGALNYYNEVMGTTVNKPDVVGQSDAADVAAKKLYSLSNLTTSAGTTNGSLVCTVPSDGTTIAVTFKIFLNGWDEYCYDCCKGQEFDMQMSFTSKDLTPAN